MAERYSTDDHENAATRTGHLLMNTQLLLAAQYDGLAIIPLNRVCKDYFPHLSEQRLIARIQTGEIKLPIVRTDPGSQKSARGIAIEHLALWLDERKRAAEKELKSLTS
ncbi:pyocin activator PrtN family protein [Azospirillum sp.]|uniref:pyocin activator PrtN family protein n=1 Tax=Azospirillum sp. TaxID=34012 RepID=UPI003D72B581